MRHVTEGIALKRHQPQTHRTNTSENPTPIGQCHDSRLSCLKFENQLNQRGAKLENRFAFVFVERK